MNTLNNRQVLGCITAEIDTAMLDLAFYESVEYKNIIEHDSGHVIVGRRGTGKSSIFYRIKKHYANRAKTKCLSIAPDESDIVYLRGLWKKANADFRTVRAGMRVVWRYSIYMESLLDASSYYKVKDTSDFKDISQQLLGWKARGDTFIDRVSHLVSSFYAGTQDAELAIGVLTKELAVKGIQDKANKIYLEADLKYTILLDRLDEGYYSDDIGIGIVNGILQGTLDVNQKQNTQVYGVIFMRDNIYRRIMELDQDFSRNIEGQEIRLHWNDTSLLEVVAARIRSALNISGRPIDIWNQFVDDSLKGIEGFRHCLKYTLYRPRDILSLINDSYFTAAKENRQRPSYGDFDQNATNVSSARYHDLIKEYGSHIPGLEVFTKVFYGRTGEMQLSDALERVQTCRRDEYKPQVQQDLVIYNDNMAVIRVLYSVGFIGIKDSYGDAYSFCYDGKEHLGKLDDGQLKFLVHPCYWMALGIKGTLGESTTDKINDEYEIKVLANAWDYRNVMIGRLIAQLGTIAEGRDEASEFENWCLEALKIIFAGHLRELRAKPNGSNVSRRDIVGTNLSESVISRRIWESYQSRILVFEVKNYKDIGINEYTQCLRYLNGEHGSLAFIITRSDDDNLRKGCDLDHFKEIYLHNKKMIVKLSAKRLSSLLSKLRNPTVSGAVVEKSFNALLDQYIDRYLGRQKVQPRLHAAWD